MSGLLLGILLARTVAGVVAELGGWRLIYGLAAVAMLCSPSCCGARCRSRAAGARPVVRDAAALGRRADPRGAGAAPPDGARLAVDGVVQRPLDLDLVPALRSEYGYGEAVIGLFSLAGLAGARWRRSPGACRRGPPARRHPVAAAGVLGGWGLLALGDTSLAALLAGIVVLDLGVQATQILNQSVIFRLRPEARSRLNTAYMTCYFAGARHRLRRRVVRVGARRLGRGQRGRPRRRRARPAAGHGAVAGRARGHRQSLMVNSLDLGVFARAVAAVGGQAPRACRRRPCRP